MQLQSAVLANYLQDARGDAEQSQWDRYLVCFRRLLLHLNRAAPARGSQARAGQRQPLGGRQRKGLQTRRAAAQSKCRDPRWHRQAEESEGRLRRHFGESPAGLLRREQTFP